jgi:aspartyl-tRNA(Asn)/glutamyl-tRNA(Gln) amidotransferase subunit A
MTAKTEITEDLLFSSVRELGDKIRARSLSPIALAEAYLDRLEKIGPKLGAVVTVTRDRALTEAKQAEQEIKDGKYRGPLHGIPYGVKDLLATKDIPTTWGAEPYRKQVFDHDATVVKKLSDAGAVLVAKLAMVELAGGFGYNNADASFTGPGLTPWNLEYWSGGSSTGPGAATAAGLVAFSIGSETSGSIITPAAFCAVSGLRPTYGLVSRHGAMALSWTMDKLGPMCRTAEDCELVLKVIQGRDPLDPASVEKPLAIPSGKPKIGVLKDATAHVQSEVKKNFEESLKVLAKIGDLVENVPLPDMPFDPVASTIIGAEGASAFEDLLASGDAKKLRCVSDRWGGYCASLIMAVDYLKAMRLRGPMKKAMDELYAKYDAIVAPSRDTISYPIAKDFDKAYPDIQGGPPLIEAGNVVGQPAISVPNGFGPHNLPTGLQFTGRVWSEKKLLALAKAYQRETDWHKKRPSV